MDDDEDNIFKGATDEELEKILVWDKTEKPGKPDEEVIQFLERLKQIENREAGNDQDDPEKINE